MRASPRRGAWIDFGMILVCIWAYFGVTLGGFGMIWGWLWYDFSSWPAAEVAAGGSWLLARTS